MKKALLIIFLLPSLVFAQLNDKWPTSLGEAVDEQIEGLTEQDKLQIVQTMPENLPKYHFMWGMYIRNEFGLRQGNKKLLASCGSEDMHPDKASSVIIKGIWGKLRAEMVPHTKEEYEQIEKAIRKVSVPPCNSECSTIEKTLVHLNQAIKSTQTGLNEFEIQLDLPIEASMISNFTLKKTSPLSLAFPRLEFQDGIIKTYKYPKVMLKFE